MATRSLKGNINGIVLTGTWISEGHSVTFKENKEDKNEMIISEFMRGNTWQKLGHNWSMTRKVSINEAIEEQDKLIKYGYARMN